MEKKILVWEPYFFMAFGLFHLHRIWSLIDRNSYAGFWIGVLENKGLFDLFAIAVGLKFWKRLLLWMFDVNSIYWNFVWLFFILLGCFAFVLGVKLLIQRNRSIQSGQEE